MKAINTLKAILSHNGLRGSFCLLWVAVAFVLAVATAFQSGMPHESFKNQFRAIAQNPTATSILYAAEILEMDMSQIGLDRDPAEGIQIAYASLIHVKAKAQAAKDVEFRNPTEYAARLTELRSYIAAAPFHLGVMLSYQPWFQAALIHLALSMVVGTLVTWVIPWPKRWVSYLPPNIASQTY